MTKRIISGIFILTALGALGVILAGALTSGEQLIVRFLTAVIVAALGLYVISDLRLQADDDAMTGRTSGGNRLATVDAPPNSTAAFMATVTKKSDTKVAEAPADGVPGDLTQTTILKEGDPALAAAAAAAAPQSPPPPPQSPNSQKGESTDGRGLIARRSVSSHPKGPETVVAAGPLGMGESADASSEQDDDTAKNGSNVTDLFSEARTSSVHGTSGSAAVDENSSDEASSEKSASDDAAESTDEPSIDLDEAMAIDITDGNDKSIDVSSDIAAEHADADHDADETEESGELVGSMAGGSGGIIDTAGSFTPSKGLNGADLNGFTGPFDLASTTAKISFSNDRLGDNVSFGKGILNGAARTGDENDEVNGGDDDKASTELNYSDELDSPEQVWPATPANLNGAAHEPLRFDGPDDDANDDLDDDPIGHSTTLPVPAAETELQAAEYADAPLAPIIDLRDIGAPVNDTVDHAINAGEVEVIATLIEQGMLSTEGPISDRDVRTMVYVAFTSNELRKLLLAGGTPDGPNDGLDLGPVELFDERIHAPAPKTLYSGIEQPEARSQFG